MNMRPDYKNWMPKGMVASFCGGAAGSWIAALALKTGRTGQACTDCGVLGSRMCVHRCFRVVLSDVPGI